MNKPHVSVIMPVYNAEAYLPQAIKSILGQSFADFELIIINDGSADKSLGIINTFAKQDGRIKVISRSNKGLINTLNEGISKARGQYIARQDADDISQPTRLQRQIAYLKTHPGIGLLGTNIEVIDDSGRIVPRHIAFVDLLTNPSDLKLAEIFSNQFAHGSIMAKAALLKENKYNPAYKHAEDYELWSRLARRVKVANLKEALYQWRLHETGVTSSHSSEMRNQALRITRREFQYYLAHKAKYRFTFHPFSMRSGLVAYLSRKSSLYRNMALMYVYAGQRRRAVPKILISILHKPWGKKSYAFLYTIVKDRQAALALEYELY